MEPELRKLSALMMWIVIAGTGFAQDPPSEETIDYFKVNCASCHTIGGGRLAGPDLKGAHERKDRDWTVKFIMDPKSVIDSGDSYARKLLEDAKGAIMPTLPGMTRVMAGKLVDLIKSESAAEKSRFVGLVMSDRPLTAVDVQRGRDLFEGTERLVGGGPACNSCHAVRDLFWFNGGTLGPDLTSAFSRLEGRKSMGAWLSSPPSVVMRPVYAKTPLEAEEILSLVAFLQNQAEGGDAPAVRPPSLEFVLVGLGGAAGLLVLMDLLWRRRYRSVRRKLVSKS